MPYNFEKEKKTPETYRMIIYVRSKKKLKIVTVNLNS